VRRADYVHQPLKEVDLPSAETAGDEARPRPAAASCWCDAVEDDADGDRPGEAPAGYRQQATAGTLDRLDLQLRADGEPWPAGTLRLTSHGLAARVPAGRSCAAALDALGPHLKVPAVHDGEVGRVDHVARSPSEQTRMFRITSSGGVISP
jgi:hypothetical protein